jgi:tetratricopeptide (TPR) repeat protein
MALALGSAAATKLARADDADRLMTALGGNAAWGEFVYVAKFAQQSLDMGDQAAPLAVLREGLLKFPTSRILASNLYSNLRVDEVPAAAEAMSLSRVLRQSAALTVEECVHLIAAHFTLGEWQDAESEARAAIAKFGETERLMSMLAVAVEMRGRTGEAVGLLERAVSLGPRKLATLRNYLGLCLRLGRMDAAQNTIERLLEVESDRAERLELLRLDALILAQQGLNDRALAVVKELGRLVNPEIEVEEGMYLNLYMGVTLNNEFIPDTEKQAFWQRVEAFCTRWPESRIFRQVKVPARGLTTLDDLHDMLDGVLGDSRERLRMFQERERKARSGDLPVPFVARPSFVFHYIGDCFTLWNVAKRSRPEDRQFHLTLAMVDEARATDRVLRDVPLLDLTALLVLQDLGLFETLFALFPRIAVPKSTVDYISQNARGLLVNPGVVEAAGALLTTVNSNIHRIDQLSSDRIAARAVNPSELLRDYAHLAAMGRWAVYTDDAITRTWIRGDHPDLNYLCTVDFLALADDRGLLTPVEVASHLEHLASWNVGITVSPRYLLAALDGALGGSTHLTGSERLDRFHAHLPFGSLARAIWHLGKEPKELVGHMGVIVDEMLSKSETERESAAAVWAFWFFRVSMVSSLGATGQDPLHYSLLLALGRLPFDAAPRAIGTFLKTIEIVVGPKRMTRQHQKSAITRLGKVTAALARRNFAVAEQLRRKVAIALPQGTEDGDIFNDAYLEVLRETSKEVK